MSLGVIKEISEANIRSVMVTGDNLLTSVNVARECGIIGPEVKLLIAETTTYPSTPTLKWRILNTKQEYTEKPVPYILHERYNLD